MEKPNGVIHHRERMAQLPVFEGLTKVRDDCNTCKPQSPTDIDLFYEFQKTLRIVVEYKLEETPIKTGQRLTLTNDLEMTNYPFSFLIFAEHSEHDSSKDYPAETAIVKEVHYKIGDDRGMYFEAKNRPVKWWWNKAIEISGVGLSDLVKKSPMEVFADTFTEAK